jgi:membrane protease YdiL (CAAX protease family)
LSSPQDPLLEPPADAAPQSSQVLSPGTVSPPLIENPPWSEWHVLQIAALTIAAIVSFLFAVTYAAHQWLYPKVPAVEVAKHPLVTVVAQLLAYLLVLVFMVAVVKRRRSQPFWQAIQWNWPRSWPAYLLGGVVLALGLQGVAHMLPMPKELPIDRFFQTPSEAWALSLFGISLAPLLEELFFRGFLYPVLARRLGIVIAVILTALSFGLIHAPQLGRAWAPVLVVFMIGLALTITRAVTKSVAAGLLMHIAYNGTISTLLFVGSDGFRHLERLNQ